MRSSHLSPQAALWLAIRDPQGPDLHGVAEALGIGASPDEPEAGQPMTTPLKAAVAMMSRPLLEALLEGGADVGLPNAITGTTPLLAAAWGGWADGVAAMAASCDLRARDKQGFNALMLACLAKSADCVRMLAPLSDLQARNGYGQDVFAIMRRHGEPAPHVEAILREAAAREDALRLRAEISEAASTAASRKAAPL